jgi:polygalacturonase
MEGVTIRESPFWTIHPYLSRDIVLRGLDVSCGGRNSDGVDPEMSRNVLIEHCVFDQGDDVLAIKAGRDHDGWRLGVATENVVFRHNRILGGHQMVAIGTELSAGVRNVHIADCRVEPDGELGHLLHIKTNNRRGGVVEHVTMERVSAPGRIRGVLGIETDVLYQWRKLVPCYRKRRTVIREIHVAAVEAGRAGYVCRLRGDWRRPVETVSLRDVTIGTVEGTPRSARFVRRLREQNVVTTRRTDADGQGGSSR